jgi:N-acetylglucosaminyldiphosphoundecaprenol N-acetyl-beta-D-mannosaminyltransferase
MQINTVRILGAPISTLPIGDTLGLFEAWLADERSDRYVVFRDAHGLVRARRDPQLHSAHENADVIAPDGLPIVWAAKAMGEADVSRVCGPDLMLAACAYGATRGWRHYFYGATPEVLALLVMKLKARFPGLQVVGTSSPPFRALSAAEDDAECAAIRSSRPDFVWVGLGTPKQELWMSGHRGKLGGAIALGVGAAFDLHAGTIRRAPRWVQQIGMEWGFRLLQEPRRLWKRYLMTVPVFAVLAASNAIRHHFLPAKPAA